MSSSVMVSPVDAILKEGAGTSALQLALLMAHAAVTHNFSGSSQD